MSSRDLILARVRRNQPRLARRCRRCRASTGRSPTRSRPSPRRSTRMGGTLAEAPASGIARRFLRARFPDARRDLLGDAGSRAGTRQHRRRAAIPASSTTSTSASCAPRSASPRPARSGSASASSASTRSASCRSTSSSCSIRPRSSPNLHHAYRAARLLRSALRSAHDRPVGDRRHRGRADPRARKASERSPSFRLAAAGAGTAVQREENRMIWQQSYDPFGNMVVSTAAGSAAGGRHAGRPRLPAPEGARRGRARPARGAGGRRPRLRHAGRDGRQGGDARRLHRAAADRLDRPQHHLPAPARRQERRLQDPGRLDRQHHAGPAPAAAADRVLATAPSSRARPGSARRWR